MRKALVVMAAATLLAACGDRSKAPTPAAAAKNTPSGKTAVAAMALAKPERQVRKATKLAKNTKRSAADGKDRNAEGEEGFRSPPISLVQSPPSEY
jgi:hypothetical protein